MSNSQSDPSRSSEPELMRLSKARPPSGDLDYSKFAPKKAGAAPAKTAHYDTSKYMEQLREEDPWPDEDAFQNSSEIKVTLVTCEITTAAADLAFDKPVHVKAEVQIIKAPDDQSVRLRLQRAASAAGPWTDLTEVVSRTITTAVSPPNQTVETDLLLATPNPVPAFGADVFYRAVAINNQAAVKESPVVTVKYRRLTEMVGAPEITHPEHSLIPRLGEDGMLVRALAAYLGKVASQPPATADKAVVFGFSYLEKDLKKNRKLSLQRAEVLKSLLDRDSTLWEKHRGDFTTRDKQQILSDLKVGFGWDCDPGKVDGLSGPKTSSGVRGFQKEYNRRYAPLDTDVKLTVDGICGKKTWNGIHRALCALVAKQMDPAFADPAPPAWQVPDWHYAPGAGAYPNGQDFPPPDRGGELNLFHPSDAPALVEPTDTTPLTVAENPVEDPTKYQKLKIPVAPLGGALPVDPDRAMPTIETYDPAEPVTESGTNAKRIERSGQVVEIRQWVNLTTKDQGRDGKGTKVKLRIRSKDALRDEPNAKKLPDQVFLKVLYSADGGPAARVPRSDADNKFGLVSTPNLAAVTSPSAASLQRAASGGWQTAPTAPWEYTATINTAGAKMVEIELDTGLCGGDTCEVQVGATNACDAARVRFVNWRRLSYELAGPGFLFTPTAAAGSNVDLPSGIKTELTRRLDAGYVSYDVKSCHIFDGASAPVGTVVPAAFVRMAGRDRFIHGWQWPLPVAFGPNDVRNVRMTLCDRSFVGCFTETVAKDLVAVSTSIPAQDLSTDANRQIMRCLERYPATPSNPVALNPVEVAGCTWVAKVTAAANTALPTLSVTDSGDPALGADHFRLEVLNPAGAVANTQTFSHPGGNDSAATHAIDQAITFALEKNFRYSCARAIRFRLMTPTGTAHTAHLRALAQTRFSAMAVPVAYHPGLDPDGNPRTGNVDRAWFKLTDYMTISVDFSLSGSGPNHPGGFVGPATTAGKCPVSLAARYTLTKEVLGAALFGDQIICLNGTDPATASTMSHELGHLMGLTAFINGSANSSGSAPGMPVPTHVDAAVPSHGLNYRNGPVAGNGIRLVHQGPHCSHGLAPATIALPTLGWNVGQSGDCIMYGNGAPSQVAFCPECVKVFRSRKLEDIQAAWSTRF